MALDFEHILAEALRKAGWRVPRSRRLADTEPDLIALAKDRRYAIELKAASEGRRARVRA